MAESDYPGFDEAHWTQVVADDPHEPDEISAFLGIDVNDPLSRFLLTREGYPQDTDTTY